MQVAKQQGEFVAQLMHKHRVRSGEALPADTKQFKYSHKGSLAYVGKDRAVMDVPGVSPLTGYGAGKCSSIPWNVVCLSVLLQVGICCLVVIILSRVAARVAALI